MLVYDDPLNHVEKRLGLSAELRRQLFDLPRERWMRHPRMGGEAEFWLQIHEGLLGVSAQLATWSRKLTLMEEPEAMRQAARRIATLGGQLVHHAHGHHHIEDHYFFPVFLRAFPQLAPPLELLDYDHKVLATVLDDLEGALGELRITPDGGEQSQRDFWRCRAERLLGPARRLDALFVRHIGDEEEICVPAMLQG